MTVESAGTYLNRPIPKLRPLDVKPVEREGQLYLLFRDPLNLRDKVVMIPQAIGAVVAFFDGRRDAEAVSAAIAVRSGVRISPTVISSIAEAFSENLMLDDERAEEAISQALQNYRSRPARPPALAGSAYPEDPEKLTRYLEKWVQLADPDAHTAPRLIGVRGLISPHIDYMRGGIVYARTWKAIQDALREIEVAIILGTDHYGGHAEITLTRQNYATPLGILPTAVDLVDYVVDAVGRDAAFQYEIRHSGEHSVELAAVWLQFVYGRSGLKIIPILIGSFYEFLRQGELPEKDERVRNLIEALSDVVSSRRALIVVAGDLTHWGPAFGSPPVSPEDRIQIENKDKQLVMDMAMSHGDNLASEFARHPFYETICGLSPLYVAAKVLQPQRVEWLDYAQCPADGDGTSLVSICGALFF